MSAARLGLLEATCCSLMMVSSSKAAGISILKSFRWAVLWNPRTACVGTARHNVVLCKLSHNH
jgi:hypothetical protein